MRTPTEGYLTQRGSDILRDGMYLELIDTLSGDEVAEFFVNDQTKKFQISVFSPELPLEAVEYLIGRAKKDLPQQKAG
jgi:hypothetical protein